jgi:TonB-linked SusC/RagA family outer membrane protein
MCHAIVIVSFGMAPLLSQAQDTVVASRPVPNDKNATDGLLSRRVTLRLKDVSRSDALDALSQNAKVFIQYMVPMLAEYPGLVSIDASAGLPLGVALERVLDGTPLRVSTDGVGHLTIVAGRDSANDSARPVGTFGGRVTDSASGRALTGAMVKIAGTKLSAITGDSGLFVIRDVPAGQQLVMVKLFGYRPLEHEVTIAAAQRTTMRLRMVATPNVLSGVVTTATGVQRRVEIGSDVTSINADSVLRTAPIESMTDLLETRVPGLQVVHTSGTPGAPARIRLRGVNSISENNDPIVIVDGIRVFAVQSDSVYGSASLAKRSYVTPSVGDVYGTSLGSYATPSPLDQIDPNSVERVDVFKGPAATAIYGSEAANGVIVVTTKRGRAGETHWTSSLDQGLSYMPGKYPEVLRGWGHEPLGANLSGGTPVLCTNSGTIFGSGNAVPCIRDSVNVFQALNIPRLTVFGHGTNTNVSTSVTGGAAALTYALTGTGSTEIGLLKLPDIVNDQYRRLVGGEAPGWMRRPDKYTRWGGTGNIQAQLNPVTRMSVTTSLLNGTQQQSSLQDAIGQLANAYVDTTLVGVPSVKRFYERSTAASLTTNAAGQLTWSGISWLPLELTGGINTVNSTDKTLVPRGIVWQFGTADSSARLSPDTAGYFAIGRRTSIDRTANLSAPRFPLSRFFTGSVGVNLHTSSNAALSSSVYRIPAGASEPTSLGCPPDVGSGSVTAAACGESTQQSASATTYGWYFVPTLNYNSRFFVSPGFRFDGGSSSGSNAGLTGFPKIELSWVAHDPDAQTPLLGFIGTLRPRLAFGVAGVQPGPSDRLRLVSDTVGSLDGGATFVDQVQVSAAGNTRLRPERSSSIEGGLDVDVWKNRLSMTITAYRQMRHDAIVTLPVAQSVNGGGFIRDNVGLIRNVGSEWTIDASLLQRTAFGWHAGVSGSTNHNRVLRTDSRQKQIDFSTGNSNAALRTLARPGYPLFGQWTYPILGYRDANNDGRIQPSEILVGDSLIYIGQQVPDYQLAFNNDVTVGRFSLHATANYVNGLTQVNAANQGLSAGLYDPSASLADQVLSVAQFVGAGSRAVLSSPLRGSAIGAIQTVSTLRLQWLSLGYNAPVSVARWFRSKTMTVALQGSNLWLHTNYRGKDPDVNSNATGNATADAGALPQPRTWSLGITLGN